MKLPSENCQLVLIDYQQRLMPHMSGYEGVVANALRLAKMATVLDIPVVGTEQSPDKLGGNVAELKALCQTTVSKTHFDACADGLLDVLHKNSELADTLPTIVIAGCEAHVCLLQSVLGLLMEGMDVWVVTDACGSRVEESRQAAFDRLQRCGAELLTTEMVGFEWLKTAEHPQFRHWQGLIKAKP